MFDLYWIHLEWHKDPFTQGYIGFSNNYEKRLEEHKESTYKVGKKIRKHKNVIIDTLHSTKSQKEIKRLEKHYRPYGNIGWNVAPGGGGGRQPDDVLDKISNKIKSYHNDLIWKKEVWEPSLQKRSKSCSETMLSKEWRDKIGYENLRNRQTESLKKTLNSKEWKETKEKDRVRKIKQTKSDPKWREWNKKRLKENRDYSGSNNPNATPIEFEGMRFDTIKEASEHFGLSKYFLIKKGAKLL